MATLSLSCPGCAGTIALDLASRDGPASRLTEFSCPSCARAFPTRAGVIQWDDEPGLNDYPPDLYAIDAALEDAHWWWRSRNAWILAELRAWHRLPAPARAFEIGCGTGFVLAALQAEGWAVGGMDMHHEGLVHAARRCTGPLLRTGSMRLPLAAPVELLVLCDVLEHVEEAPMLTELRRVVDPAGGLLVTVPARPSLFGAEDVAVGHLRRYTPASLRTALERGGFRVERLRGFHSWLTPLAERAARRAGPLPDREAALERLKSARARPPRPASRALFASLCALERGLAAWLPARYGTHLLALATPA